MALWSKVFVINPTNKPFGDVLPLEIQNRIVCMSWYSVHRDRFRTVLSELGSRPVCRLVDWCRFHQSSSSPFQFIPTCNWCHLYTYEDESIDMQLMCRRLQTERDTLRTEEQYQAFTQRHINAYSAISVYTVTLLLPMFVYLPPHLQQFDHSRVIAGTTFNDVDSSIRLLLASFRILAEQYYHNPRLLAERYFQQQQNNAED